MATLFLNNASGCFEYLQCMCLLGLDSCPLMRVLDKDWYHTAYISCSRTSVGFGRHLAVLATTDPNRTLFRHIIFPSRATNLERQLFSSSSILSDEHVVDVDPSKLAHPENCKLLDPWRDPSQNSTPPCAGPTVGANCHGIVTADVLSVRT